MLLLWQINGGDLFVFVQKYHNNGDFWAMVFHFAFSNILHDNKIDAKKNDKLFFVKNIKIL